MGVSACALLGDESGEKSLTWEEAKTATQATELEIAELVPDAYVASIVQKPTGTLFSCDDGQHTWYGSTTIALTPDADAEQIVKTLESHFREDDRFDVRNRRDVVDEYEIQLMSPGSAETYVIGPDGATTLLISSGSTCFTLPEGVYPGGKF